MKIKELLRLRCRLQSKSNAKSKNLGEATLLLHRFSTELRKAQQKKATGDGRITSFFRKVKDPKLALQ
jgi:hypothetical protein